MRSLMLVILWGNHPIFKIPKKLNLGPRRDDRELIASPDRKGGLWDDASAFWASRKSFSLLTNSGKARPSTSSISHTGGIGRVGVFGRAGMSLARSRK